MTETKKSIIDNFKSYLSFTPIVYAGLVFLGYMNIDFYYRKFDISIYSYLETSELLFSFLDLLYPLLLMILAFGLFMFLMAVTERKKNLSEEQIRLRSEYKKRTIEELDSETNWQRIFRNLKEFFVNLRKGNFRKAKDNFGEVILWSVSQIMIFSLWVFGIFYGVVFLFQFMFIDVLTGTPLAFGETQLQVGIAAVWFMILTIYLSTRDKKVSINYLIVIGVVLLTSNLHIYQNKTANSVQINESERHIRFTYEGLQLTTNDEKALIGITKNYIFLRDTSTDENLVFNQSDVKNMVLYSEKESLK